MASFLVCSMAIERLGFPDHRDGQPVPGHPANLPRAHGKRVGADAPDRPVPGAIGAADYYRKAIDVIRNHPDNYDPEFEAVFQRLIDRLEPKVDAAAD
jgi:hypothetical protein